MKQSCGLQGVTLPESPLAVCQQDFKKSVQSQASCYTPCFQSQYIIDTLYISILSQDKQFYFMFGMRYSEKVHPLVHAVSIPPSSNGPRGTGAHPRPVTRLSHYSRNYIDCFPCVCVYIYMFFL